MSTIAMSDQKAASTVSQEDQSLNRTWETKGNESNSFLQDISTAGLKAYTTDRLQFFRKRSLRNLTGWRITVALGCACTVFALICNITILIWAHTMPKGASNTFVLHNGDCEGIKAITTWSHLGINIIATLVLSGSNYAMQVLMAPTRDDADVAHARDCSVDIGVPSLTNWIYLSRKRQLLYIGLLLTSIPFHTIYNSILFDTTSAVDFGMYLVTRDFFEALPTFTYSTTPPAELVYHIWTSAMNQPWDNITKEDCYSIFSAPYLHDYMNVILVTNVSSATYEKSWLANTAQLANTAGLINEAGSSVWLCGSRNCKPDMSLVKSWNVSFTVNVPQKDAFSPFLKSTHYGTQIAFVKYCIAEPTQPSCTMELSPQLLVAAIVCNVVKVAILILLLCSTFTPLVTIGDAIASYIDEPDPSTKDLGAISARDLYKNPEPGFASIHNSRLIAVGLHRRYRKKSWRNQKAKYFSGATSSRWKWTLCFWFAYLIFGVSMLIIAGTSRSESLQQVWQDGMGSIAPGRVVPWRLGFLPTVIIVNVPQLLLSFVYLYYNSTLTSILLSQEWTNYAHHRKSLRVTDPTGEQRSTYFLSLPYRFSIPLLIASAFLHWSLSQSIFFAQVNFTDFTGLPDPDHSILTAGFSPIGLLILVPIGAIMFIALILLGFRHYESGIPLALSDSRAISAACHAMAQIGEEERPSLKRLQYGVVADLGQRRYRIGFSSGPVQPLVEGEYYDYRAVSDFS